ncbi:hypothetical protein SDC9_135979 [bioreactor metagenome]|uniref:Uncharacterized protein n=1 Tax=bioreactor metagenome TaxID=1076179 RepID=A0A645DI33_9ZZZZ
MIEAEKAGPTPLTISRMCMLLGVGLTPSGAGGGALFAFQGLFRQAGDCFVNAVGGDVGGCRLRPCRRLAGILVDGCDDQRAVVEGRHLEDRGGVAGVDAGGDEGEPVRGGGGAGGRPGEGIAGFRAGVEAGEEHVGHGRAPGWGGERRAARGGGGRCGGDVGGVGRSGRGGPGRGDGVEDDGGGDDGGADQGSFDGGFHGGCFFLQGVPAPHHDSLGCEVDPDSRTGGWLVKLPVRVGGVRTLAG